MASNKQILKDAQAYAGIEPTGYKADLTEEAVDYICEKMWARSKNLGYTVGQWMAEVVGVIGKESFGYWYVNILDFQKNKIKACKTFVVLGTTRYCA